MLPLPVILGVALSLTLRAMGVVGGIKLGRRLEKLLTKEEKEDLKEVVSWLMNRFGIFKPEEIKDLHDDHKKEFAGILSQKLIDKWGKYRFEEFRYELEKELSEDLDESSVSQSTRANTYAKPNFLNT